MKKILIVLTFLLLISGCATNTNFKFKPQSKLKELIPAKRLKLISFFINKELSWYGAMDRFYGKFYTIDPIAQWFTKQCLVKIHTTLDKKIDYIETAKKEKIDLPVKDDYTSAKGLVIFNKFVDYYPLLKKIGKKGDYFLIMENQYSIIQKNADNRASLLVIDMYIMDAVSNIVYAKTYTRNVPFSAEDYKILVHWQGYNKNEIQKRLMQLFSEEYIKISGRIIRDLGLIIKN